VEIGESLEQSESDAAMTAFKQQGNIQYGLHDLSETSIQDEQLAVLAFPDLTELSLLDTVTATTLCREITVQPEEFLPGRKSRTTA
jgi:hypothetical protein